MVNTVQSSHNKLCGRYLSKTVAALHSKQPEHKGKEEHCVIDAAFLGKIVFDIFSLQLNHSSSYVSPPTECGGGAMR